MILHYGRSRLDETQTLQDTFPSAHGASESKTRTRASSRIRPHSSAVCNVACCCSLMPCVSGGFASDLDTHGSIGNALPMLIACRAWMAALASAVLRSRLIHYPVSAMVSFQKRCAPRRCHMCRWRGGIWMLRVERRME